MAQYIRIRWIQIPNTENNIDDISQKNNFVAYTNDTQR